MKVSMESAAASYINKTNVGMKNGKPESIQESSQKFDQIMINSNSRQLAEEKLIDAAKKDIEGAVFRSASEEKIQNLKQQVAEGMYRIDPEAIASKILFLGGVQ